MPLPIAWEPRAVSLRAPLPLHVPSYSDRAGWEATGGRHTSVTPPPKFVVPESPTIYHIVHVNRLASIVRDGYVWSDAEATLRKSPGTAIGISGIKERRRTTEITSHPGLRVGDCVPFYFCPRSVMLYVIYRQNDPNLSYRCGQAPIVHLQANLYETVEWADAHGCRWAFTLSNAGARYFEDRCDLADLNQIDWSAVQARDWRPVPTKTAKQAEFLVESRMPWSLIRVVGTQTSNTAARAQEAIVGAQHMPEVVQREDWYY